MNYFLRTTARAVAFLTITAPLLSAEVESRQAFLLRYCADCHNPRDQAGSFDLEAIGANRSDQDGLKSHFDHWVRTYDRVAKREMPPSDSPQPTVGERESFRTALERELFSIEQDRISREGRSTQRRMNRFEYEATLREVLNLPWLEVKSFLPEDTESHGFNKIGDALDVSHVQVARYLAAAEHALREAMAPHAERPRSNVVRYYASEQPEFWARVGGPKNRMSYRLLGLELQRELLAPLFSPADPDSEAFAVVVSTYEPTLIGWGKFHAPISGKYRLRFSGYSCWMNSEYTKVTRGRRPEPVLVYADIPPSNSRKLGGFDFAAEPTVGEVEAHLLAGETVHPDAARLFRSRPPDFLNPLEEADGMPAVAYQWMEVEGPLFDSWPPESHRRIFGDLPVRTLPRKPRAIEHSVYMGDFTPAPGVEVLSDRPEEDAARLVRDFTQRVYRRPPTESELDQFAMLARNALHEGHSFTEAVIAADIAVLSSPGFLFMDQTAGRLSGRALAERLSYFLWNSTPDAKLLALADDGKLSDLSVLRDQTERLLGDSRSEQSLHAFLDYWLDLRLMAGTQPDGELYPEYQLDDLLVDSLLDETRTFFKEIVKNDLPVRNLIDSKFAIVNERLATHYGVPGVLGLDMRSVQLPEGSERGGLLTQGSILKVTANGTTTSPVKRGAWVMSRLLGKPPDPPPASVPAVEPDTRGATTIREQLARHRNDATCNACHRHIDPAGFALENFDVMGAWRERYRSLGEGEPVKGIGHNSLLFHYRNALPVDASGELPDGQTFQGIRELKACLARDEAQIARNLVERWIVYATGAPIGFSDRRVIDEIVKRHETDHYPARALLHEVVQSPLFVNK